MAHLLKAPEQTILNEDTNLLKCYRDTMKWMPEGVLTDFNLNKLDTEKIRIIS